MATRNSTRHAIFGNPNDLPQNVLPTNLQVGQYFLLMKPRRNDSNRETYKVVAEAVVHLWKMASIPIIQIQSVVKRVEILITTGSELCRSKSSSNRKDTFLNSLDMLFDIAACKCLMSSDALTKEIVTSCNCARELKVPREERSFLFDQRNCRSMIIGSVDTKATISMRKRVKRKCSEKRRIAKVQQTSSNVDNFKTDMSDDSDDMLLDVRDDDTSSTDANVNVSISVDEFFGNDAASTSQMRLPLPNLAKEADRYGISDRATASLATAVLIDIEIVTKEDQSLVIDKSKVRRERMKLRKK